MGDNDLVEFPPHIDKFVNLEVVRSVLIVRQLNWPH